MLAIMGRPDAAKKRSPELTCIGASGFLRFQGRSANWQDEPFWLTRDSNARGTNQRRDDEPLLNLLSANPHEGSRRFSGAAGLLENRLQLQLRELESIMAEPQAITV